jgi:DnaJ like chaperone protein
MRWTGKLIGGALGAALGPVGIAVGAMIGHQYDLMTERRGSRPVAEQFFRSVFRVMGHLAKADGRVTEREIEAARNVMRSLKLDAAQTRVAIAHFTDGKAPGFALDTEMAELRASAHSHPVILGIFLEIQLRFALWGSDMSGATRERMARVAAGLGVTPALFARMEAAMRGESRTSPGSDHGNHAARVAAAYRTLEVDPTVNDADLTRAYRRMMSRHHPDKLKANGLPDSMLEHAKQRTQAIREAWELLQEHRGLA